MMKPSPSDGPLPAGDRNLKAVLHRGADKLRAAEIPSPRLEAELLLCALLHLPRMDVYRRPLLPLSSGQITRFLRAVARRCAHEPLQYITQEVTFYGFTLKVLPGVFIPRPETEMIVEAVRAINPPGRVLDLCTGSGALAVSIGSFCKDASVVGIDISAKAIWVARMNTKRLPHVTFLQGDLFQPLQRGKDVFDLIICNPPYIAPSQRWNLPIDVRDFEPQAALFAEDEGTAFYRRILQEAPSYLAPNGILIFELGDGVWFRKHVREETMFEATLLPDLSGIDRVAICKRRV